MNPQCQFCGNGPDDVDHIIVGTASVICGRCVEECAAINKWR